MTVLEKVKSLPGGMAPCACGCGTPAPVRRYTTAHGPAGSPSYAHGHYPAEKAARANYPSRFNKTNIYLDEKDRKLAAKLMKKKGLESLSALIRFLIKEG